MEKYLNRVQKFISNNKKEVLFLFLLLLLASFLRLYKIREFIIFLGDEGRDALVVKRMLVDHKFTLLGPTASVGGFYLGPIYYYFMLPFLWLFNFDPVGPAIMVAAFGVATVFLLYKTVREWIGVRAAALTSIIYASAPGIVTNSRSSWNPNIMPFFSLLAVYAVYQGLAQKKAFWFIISGISLGVAIQSHYLGLILGPVLAAAILLNTKPKLWLQNAFYEAVGFFIGASMYFAFEIRHSFPNIRSVLEFVTRGGNTTGPRSFNLIWLFADITRRTFESVFFSSNLAVGTLVLVGFFGFICYLIYQKLKRKAVSLDTKIFLIWFLIGVFGMGSYKGQLYPHYFGFIFPVPFFLLAYALFMLDKVNRNVAPIFTTLLVVMNLFNLPIWKNGSNLINQTENISEEIIQMVGDEQFNFALIADGNSDHAYRYFLEIANRKPQPLEERITGQLLVVCEDLNNPCYPLGHPLWEVAGFGRAEISDKRIVHPGVTIYKLIHHQDSVELIGKPAPKG